MNIKQYFNLNWAILLFPLLSSCLPQVAQNTSSSNTTSIPSSEEQTKQASPSIIALSAQYSIQSGETLTRQLLGQFLSSPTSYTVLDPNPLYGQLTVDTFGVFNFSPQPDLDFRGQPSLQTSFRFIINSNNHSSSIATISITILAPIVPVARPPIAVNDRVSLNEDQTIIINLLENDIIPDSSSLIELSNEDLFNFSSGGSATILADKKSVLYRPAKDFSGLETFNYTIKDNLGNTTTATVFANISPINDPPIAPSAPVVLLPPNSKWQGPIVEGSDPDNLTNQLVYTITQMPQNGLAQFNNTIKTVEYTPNPGFKGADFFSYTISDPVGGISNTAMYLFSVDDANIEVDNNAFTITQIDNGKQFRFPFANDSNIPAGHYDGETFTSFSFILNNLSSNDIVLTSFDMAQDQIILTSSNFLNAPISPNSTSSIFTLSLNRDLFRNTQMDETIDTTLTIFFRHLSTNQFKKIVINLQGRVDSPIDLNLPLKIVYIRDPEFPDADNVDLGQVEHIKEILLESNTFEGRPLVRFVKNPRAYSINAPRFFNLIDNPDNGGLTQALLDLSQEHGSEGTLSLFILNSLGGRTLGVAFEDRPLSKNVILNDPNFGIVNFSKVSIAALDKFEVSPLKNAGVVTPHEVGHSIGLHHTSEPDVAALNPYEAEYFSKTLCGFEANDDSMLYLTYLVTENTDADGNIMNGLASPVTTFYNSIEYETKMPIRQNCYDQISRTNLDLPMDR